MSRVGRKPIPVPDKVQVALDAGVLRVQGPLGELSQAVPAGVGLRVDGGVAHVEPPPAATRANRGYQGLVRALLANMVAGVTQGYEKSCEVSGLGYKIDHSGDTLTMTVGFSHPVVLKLPPGVRAEVPKNQTQVTIKGIDKQLVGQTAARIRAVKDPEPYNGKGVKYVGEQIQRKVGKTGAK